MPPKNFLGAAIRSGASAANAVHVASQLMAAGVTVIAHDAQGLALDDAAANRCCGRPRRRRASRSCRRASRSHHAGRMRRMRVAGPEHRTLAAIYKVPTPRDFRAPAGLLAARRASWPTSINCSQRRPLPWLPASEPREKLHACYTSSTAKEAGGLVWTDLSHYRCGEARPCIGPIGWRYSACPIKDELERERRREYVTNEPSPDAAS